MSDNPVPQQIWVITGLAYLDDQSLEPRRGFLTPTVPNLASVDISGLKSQVNVFLQQLNVIMSETPEKVGEFRLNEFEVSVGIVVEATGGVQLALLANAEASGQVNASFKLVFKRS